MDGRSALRRLCYDLTMKKPASHSVPPQQKKRRSAANPKRQKGIVRNATVTKDNLLNAALKVFAEGGFDGGRISRISRVARSNDRMIYYYFGSKEKLFVEVLEKVYR